MQVLGGFKENKDFKVLKAGYMAAMYPFGELSGKGTQICLCL
jgi:hypothetical protein